MTVYVMQQPTQTRKGWTPNLQPATEFGEIQYVFPGGVPIYTSPVKTLKMAKNALANFNPDEDYLLWPNTGDPAAMWVCCFAIVLLGFSKVRFLYWNRKYENGNRIGSDGFYVPITYKFEDGENEGN